MCFPLENSCESAGVRSTGKGETREGELDQLVQEECGDWIFRLIEEGKESNPAGVCLRPSNSEFVQGSSGQSAES